MNTPPLIVRAKWARIMQIAAIIADAFTDLPAARWLVPDPADRPMRLRGQFAILVEHALLHGHVHTTTDESAAAVWFDRLRPLPEPYDYHQRLAAACGPYTERFTHLDHLFDLHHPPGAHHHLALIAVTPNRQGQGLGSALLQHHHTHLDQVSTPAYLEASSPASRDLYQRHGYHTGQPFTLPDGTPFWPMWRHPQSLPGHQRQTSTSTGLPAPWAPTHNATSSHQYDSHPQHPTPNTEGSTR